MYRYPQQSANNPGLVARFPAHKPGGSLTATFEEVRNPRRLVLSLGYGWGWGDPTQGADSISFMLLDSAGSGYVLEVRRCKARWAAQWGRVANGVPAKDKTWATDEGGNQTFGFFRRDDTPRRAAVYLHNLTTILADQGSIAEPGQLKCPLPEQPLATHEMLLQKSDGTFVLAVWNERLKGRR